MAISLRLMAHGLRLKASIKCLRPSHTLQRPHHRICSNLSPCYTAPSHHAHPRSLHCSSNRSPRFSWPPPLHYPSLRPHTRPPDRPSQPTPRLPLTTSPSLL